MSAVSSDDQRVKRSAGVDAQDLEDSVRTVRDDFQRVLVFITSNAAGVVNLFSRSATVSRSQQPMSLYLRRCGNLCIPAHLLVLW